MKTKNNVQETKSQVEAMVLRGVAVIFSLVLISWTVSAQNLWSEFLSNNAYGKAAMLMVDQSNESERVDAIVKAADAELTARTKQSTDNLVSETVTANELLGLESVIMHEDLLNSAENLTAKEADLEIEKYAEKLILTQENRADATAMNFLSSAEDLTATESDLEVEKYAQRLILSMENRTEIIGATDFMSTAEELTRMEADHHIEKYAMELLSHAQSRISK